MTRSRLGWNRHPGYQSLIKTVQRQNWVAGVAKVLLYRREIDGLRGLIFGIRKKYRQLGLPLLAFDYLFRNVIQNPKYDKYRYVELGSNLKTMI